MTKPSLPELLHAAVAAVGGTERPGQVTMAEAVAEAIDDGAHLLVQAGTGTGKSLGYLVPALAHGERVVVATATLALQRKLVGRALPRTVEALHPLLRRRPEFAMLKGRSNYLCLHRLHEGVPQDEEEGLFDQFEAAAPTSKLGQDLLRLRDWADETESGDRDGLTPGVSDRAWSQVAVSSRECLGATKCAYGAECFAEMARERAKLAEVVVTNHALLAIDAIEGAPVLPPHEVLIVDEAHELVSRVTAVASVENVHAVAERITHGSEWDVVWYERHDRFGASLRVAPMSVSDLLREKLFADRSVVLTSATLNLGGDFNGVGASLGLAPEGTEGDDVPQWKGVDVGSPFDYPRQGILYVAKHLARPARDGDRADMLDELTELIQAAGGRTLGLFSSMRAAQLAAEELRSRIPEFPILLQGEETLGELIKNFAADPKTCLFGTLSLWQGVDVPGPSCQLVVMDKIPFPRPDDPLMSARQKAVEEAGGNGFMAVAATHAALLMAQGAGRLVRASGDRGVVAVLDQRLATARYGSYLKASLPDFWYTTDRDQVRKSLAAIDAAAKAMEAAGLAPGGEK